MLTVTAINKAKPAIKPYKLSDEKGMYLYVAPTGGNYGVLIIVLSVCARRWH